MANIKSPVQTFNGVVAGVQFKNGEAETNDLWLIEWFRNKGYEVSGTNSGKKLAFRKIGISNCIPCVEEVEETEESEEGVES